MRRYAAIAGLAPLGALTLGAAALAGAGPARDDWFLARRASGGWPLRAPGDRALTRATQIDQANPPGRALNPRAMRDMRPMMMAGAPYDPDAEVNHVSEEEGDIPEMRVDPNLASSPFAGVGSMLVTRPDGLQVFCSCAAIGPRTVVTAGHCFDLDADGDNDVGFNVRITFNGAGADNRAVVLRPEDIVRVQFAPDFGGLKPADLHDDIAVVTFGFTDILGRKIDLAGSGVPIYPLHLGPLPGEADNPIRFFMAGYGVSGSGVDGYDFTVPPEGSIKRIGENEFRDGFLTGDDGHDEDIVEVYAYDFDPPPSIAENAGLEGPTLGNRSESLSGPGDSGAPLLIHDDINRDGQVQQGELVLFGVSSFVVAGALESSTGQFGNWGGGSLVSAYLDFFAAQLDLCFADANLDNSVDGADLAILMQDWGKPSARADLSHDGVTDGRDLAAMLANWGPCD